MKTGFRLVSPILALTVLLLIVAPGAAQTGQPDAALNKRLAVIEQKVAAVRQLPLKEPIALEFKTRDELRREVTSDLQRQYTPADQARDERVLTAFGLIPPGTDLRKVQEAVQGEQIAGYYDPGTNQMVVVRAATGPGSFTALDEIVFAHEVTHALQDQNLNLDALTGRHSDFLDDQNLALLALIEGDATSCQLDYLLANTRLIPALTAQLNSPELSSAELDKAPAFLRSTLLFPYDQGLNFVTTLKKNGGWNAVDDAYARPPVSTEQILHPQMYLAGEQPVPVSLPDIGAALGNGWTSVAINDFGELGVRILLTDQSTSSPDAKQAAAGWGGDRYQVWANGSRTALVWQTAWDTGTDAQEFVDTLRQYEAQRWHVPGDMTVPGQSWFVSSQTTTVAVQHGQDVTYVLAPDRETAARIVKSAGG